MILNSDLILSYYVRQIHNLLPKSIFDVLAYITHISSRTAQMDERCSLSGVSSAIFSACKVGGWSKLSRISRDLLGNRGNRPSSFCNPQSRRGLRPIGSRLIGNTSQFLESASSRSTYHDPPGCQAIKFCSGPVQFCSTESSGNKV